MHGNQEMIGIGAANLAAGLFQGFPVSTSASRTAVAERAGAKTQLTGVVGAALIILMIVFLPGPVPEPAAARAGRRRDHRGAVAGRHAGHRAALAAAQGRVRAVDRRLRRRRAARRAARHRRSRSACRSSTSSAARGGRTRRPSGWSTAGRATTTSARTRTRGTLPGLVIYRFDAPLFFANAKTFRDEVMQLARAEPAPRWIVVAAEPITDVDTTAADVLFELDHCWTSGGRPWCSPS